MDPEGINNFDGLSMMFAIEACFNDYNEDNVYTGDSHPMMNWLPSEGLTPEDLDVKVEYCYD
jgi:hypothetical protein